MIVNIKISLAVLCVALVFSAAPVHASATSNHQIAYTKKQHGKQALWATSADGLLHKKLADNVAGFAWSPSGRDLAYFGGTGECGDRLYLLNYATRRTSEVARGSCMAGSPSWSPDGRQLAFARVKGNGTSIVRTGLVNGHEQPVAIGIKGAVLRSPSWSPNGRQIVYEQHTKTRSTLQISAIGTGESRTLIGLSDHLVVASPLWSPSGKKIAYQDSQNEAYTIWPDGSHRAVISDGDSYEASWSPATDKLAFLEDFSGSEFSTTTPEGEVLQHDLPDFSQASVHNPSWSPNEKNMLISFDGPGGRLVCVDMQTMTAVVMASQVVDAQWRPIIPRPISIFVSSGLSI